MNKIYDKRYPVTSLLLLITTGVFLAMFLLRGFNYASTQTIYEFGAMNGRTIQYFPSQIWRLVSAIFVHIGLEHFVMNMITLYFIGRQAEDIFGSWNFLFLYLMSGILGNVFVFFFTPNVVAAGASTSLFGIFGAIIALRYAVRNPYIQQLGQLYLVLLVMNLVLSLTPGISLAGHLGGAVGGALCAVIFPVRGERRAYQVGQRLLALIAYVVLALGMIWLAFNRSI
ncbi:rhomboid family intramembrane serine protease [Streptococcus sp. IsoGale021]|uniref:rhomboid family intramembrane serine protease n=1 Tax=Streptococcus TaxID=1301 RepID=UPI002000CC9C|nr:MULTISPECIES: rhomboid family intramembrane serine protease [Streptococcus]MCY7210040.1 rhomboid family intramembrane serine protease [Streptococcus anginosus]MCY7212535.1 rhomboid family intramembrane serine protease [Streptococcus anginosus]MCY7226884.1 rhomboid family intramembrane serine protease [Streptococcus anginosus]MDQ8694955.1 rhomboid family intramembrane serine protease [Streptococcus sp. IsoGale021]MDU5129225.1 rhomboid family intramembrane serine protease [Streptococcus angin